MSILPVLVMSMLLSEKVCTVCTVIEIKAIHAKLTLTLALVSCRLT